MDVFFLPRSDAKGNQTLLAKDGSFCSVVTSNDYDKEQSAKKKLKEPSKIDLD